MVHGRPENASRSFMNLELFSAGASSGMIAAAYEKTLASATNLLSSAATPAVSLDESPGCSADAGNSSSSRCRIMRVSTYMSRPMAMVGVRRYCTPSAARSGRGIVTGWI